MTALATGDFNKDGAVDVAVTNVPSSGSGTNGVILLLNNGNGSFTPTETFATGNNPRSLVTGDFDADGNLDVITANSNSSSLSFLSGTGTGSFRISVNITLTQNNSSFAPGS